MIEPFPSYNDILEQWFSTWSWWNTGGPPGIASGAQRAP